LCDAGAEALGRRVRKANAVPAFSTPGEVLFDVFGAKRRTRRRASLLFCGNDSDAKDVASRAMLNRFRLFSWYGEELVKTPFFDREGVSRWCRCREFRCSSRFCGGRPSRPGIMNQSR
jgi:hypothetical protein